MAKHKIVLSDELRAACREYADSHDRGMRALADASGLCETVLHKFVVLGRPVKLATADRLAHTLRLQLMPWNSG